jgi:hypothetical protein
LVIGLNNGVDLDVYVDELESPVGSIDLAGPRYLLICTNLVSRD